MLDEVEGASAHVQIESLPPALRARIVRKRDRYERGAAPARRGRASAPASSSRPIRRSSTRAMLGALNWTVTWFRPDGPHDADTVSRGIADFLVRGLGSAARAAQSRCPASGGAMR